MAHTWPNPCIGLRCCKFVPIPPYVLVCMAFWSAGLGGGAARGDLAHQAIRSAGGERFDAFAKATTPGRELYLWEDAVAPFYATGTPEPSVWVSKLGRLSCHAPCLRGLPASNLINLTLEKPIRLLIDRYGMPNSH